MGRKRQQWQKQKLHVKEKTLNVGYDCLQNETYVYVSINKLEKKFYISVDSVQRKWKQNYMVWFHLGTNKTNHSVFFIWECVLAYVCMNEGKYAHHPVTVGLISVWLSEVWGQIREGNNELSLFHLLLYFCICYR